MIKTIRAFYLAYLFASFIIKNQVISIYIHPNSL
jgi:hypothetical protein